MYYGNSQFDQLFSEVYNPLARGWVFRAYGTSVNVSLTAAGAFTTSSPNITMPANPGSIVPGMTVFDTTGGFAVGTVSSYIGTALVLTANALNASSGSADQLTFTDSGQTRFNGLNVRTIQVDRPAAMPTSQSATLSTTTPNIGVTSAALFPVDMPVVLSSNVNKNGFTAGQIYFVTSSNSATNQITLGSTQGALTPITPIGTPTGVSVTQYGFPNLEIVGWDDPGRPGLPSLVETSTFNGLDLEGPATCHILLQNTASLTIDGNWIEDASLDDVRTVCMRNAVYGTMRFTHAYTIDMDDICRSNIIFGTTPEWKQINSGGNAYNGVGIRLNNQPGIAPVKDTGMLYLSGYYAPDLYIGGSDNHLVINNAVALLQQQLTAGQTVMGVGTISSFVYAGNGDGSSTLHMPQANGNNIGLQIHVSNPTTGNCVLDTGTGGSTFNNVSGATTLTISPNTSVRLESCQYGTGYYWSKV